MSHHDTPNEFMIDEVGRRHYVLGRGTDDEQYIGWPDTHRPLRNYFTSVQETLQLLRNTFASRGQLPQVAIVDGIWLNWVYCAMDVERLDAEIEATRAEIREVRWQLCGMGEVLGEIGVMLESGTFEAEKVGRALRTMGDALVKGGDKNGQTGLQKLKDVPTSGLVDAYAKDDHGD